MIVDNATKPADVNGSERDKTLLKTKEFGMKK